MEKTKKFTITLTQSQADKAKIASKKMFGRENLSGYIAVLLEVKNPTKIDWDTSKLLKMGGISNVTEVINWTANGRHEPVTMGLDEYVVFIEGLDKRKSPTISMNKPQSKIVRNEWIAKDYKFKDLENQ